VVVLLPGRNGWRTVIVRLGGAIAETHESGQPRLSEIRLRRLTRFRNTLAV
jgi:hypothetical protein